MFLFGLALMGAAPVAVEATGMEPQLRVIRQQAAKRDWPITRVGHAGEEGVIRIGIPTGTPPSDVDTFIQIVTPVASSVGDLGVGATKQSCNQKPVRMGSEAPVRVLILTAGKDSRLLAVARECGYRRAYWRPARSDDVARFGGRADIRKFPMTLDAGEDANARYGPAVCFMYMGIAPLRRR